MNEEKVVSSHLLRWLKKNKNIIMFLNMEHRLKDDIIHDLMDSRKPLMTSEVWGAEESPRETFVSRISGCAAISAW